jgi:hypothetical protein
MRIWERRGPNWTPEQVHWQSSDDPCVYNVYTPAGTYTVKNGSCVPGWQRPTTPQEVIETVRRNGVVEVGVPSRVKSFARAWGQRSGGKFRIPTVDYVGAKGNLDIDHDIFAIGGGIKRGLLVMNSWGDEWGKHGLALLTWDFFFKYGCNFLTYEWNGHPLDSAEIPWR